MKYFLLLIIIIVVFFFLISSTLSCSSSVLYPEVRQTPSKRVDWDLVDPYHCEELYSTVVEYEEYIVVYMKEDKRYRENIPEWEARKRRYLDKFIAKYYEKCWEYVYDKEGLDI